MEFSPLVLRSTFSWNFLWICKTSSWALKDSLKGSPLVFSFPSPFYYRLELHIDFFFFFLFLFFFLSLFFLFFFFSYKNLKLQKYSLLIYVFSFHFLVFLSLFVGNFIFGGFKSFLLEILDWVYGLENWTSAQGWLKWKGAFEI